MLTSCSLSPKYLPIECVDIPPVIREPINDRFVIERGDKGSVVTLIKDMKGALKEARLKHDVIVQLYDECRKTGQHE